MPSRRSGVPPFRAPALPALLSSPGSSPSGDFELVSPLAAPAPAAGAGRARGPGRWPRSFPPSHAGKFALLPPATALGTIILAGSAPPRGRPRCCVWMDMATPPRQRVPVATQTTYSPPVTYRHIDPCDTLARLHSARSALRVCAYSAQSATSSALGSCIAVRHRLQFCSNSIKALIAWGRYSMCGSRCGRLHRAS